MIALTPAATSAALGQALLVSRHARKRRPDLSRRPRHFIPSQSVATGGGLRLLAVAEIEHFVGLQAGYTGVLRDGDFVHEVHASVSLNFLGLAVFYIANER